MSAKSWKNFLKYQTKIIFRNNYWAALLVAILIPLAVNYPFYLQENMRLYWAVKMNEMFFPVLGIILFSNLISQEWDGKTEALWLSKPMPRYTVLSARVLITIAYLLVVLIIPIMAQYILYVEFGIGRMLLTLLSPTIYLGMMGLIIGAVSEKTLLGIVVPIFYWIMEISTKGQYTGMLALFSRATHPLCLTETCVTFVQGNDWIVDKIIMLLVCGILLWLCGFALSKKGRGFTIINR